MKRLYNNHVSGKWLKRFMLSTVKGNSSLKLFFLLILFSISNTFVFSQFILDGSTLNSGDYTCGTSTISQSSGFVDGTSYSLTICAAPGEVVYLNLGTIVLNDNGGSGNDDVLIISDNSGILYQDGTGSDGVDNVSGIACTVDGGCLTITLQCNDDASQPQINATIECLPAANSGPDQNPGDCSTSTSLGATDPSPASGTWSVNPSAGVSISSLTDPNATVSGMTAGTEYTFTWIVTDGTASHSDQMIFNSAGPGCVTYCTPAPAYSNSSDGYISNVNLNSGEVDNTSAWVGYNDFTGSCATIIQGDELSVEITITRTSTFPMHHVYWIDWNGNGTFEGSEEYSLGSNTATETISQTITAPCDAVVGDIVMRIATQYNSVPSDPCAADNSYGETEDYCITVSAAPTPVAAASSSYSVCATTATLDATTSSITDGFWSIISGSGSITNITSQSTTITGLENGLITLQWTSVGLCETDQAQTSFTVSGLPDAPVNAGLDAYTCTDPFGLTGSSTAPFNDPTDGFWSIVSEPGGSSASFSDANDPNSDITGLIAGTYVLQWNVVTDACGTVTDQAQVVFGSLPTPNAGTDQSGLCPTGTQLDATPVDGVTGTWSFISGPTTAGFADVNDPNTQTFNLAVGSYVLQWEFSGGGCSGATTDQVNIDVVSCTTSVTHDPLVDQEFTGCSFSFTDDGGPSGDYSSNINQTWTTFCPDDPSAFSTITLTAASMLTYDYLVIYDSDAPGSPVIGGIWDGVAYPGLNTAITSSTGCLYIQANSNATSNSSGWQADIGCSSVAGTQTQDYVQVNNCGGGGGITVCSSGPITAESNTAANPPDLGNQNQGCLGSQEGASNTWVYINAASDGWISFEVTPPGGQDYDYAIWGPYNGGYACPMQTLDEPIRCSWAANGGSACNNVVGLGVVNQDGDAVAVSDVSEGGFCADTYNEGWTYPIEASAGDVYVLLFQNYNNNNSTFGFSLNSDPNSIPSGESFASLGCDPITALPIELISFEGTAMESFNLLEWETSSERNNNYFTIEKSKDGYTWNDMVEIQGAGNSTSKNIYSYSDLDVYPGISYYRLIQTDFDGTSKLMKSIALERTGEDVFGYLYPNPGKDEFSFLYSGRNLNEVIEVTIIDPLGKAVYSMSYQDFNKNGVVKVNTSTLNKEAYFVQLRQGSKVELRRFIKL